MKTTVVGGYPKIIENQLLRKTLWAIDREGGNANGKLEEAVRTVTRAAILEQKKLGLDTVSDGGIRWQDEVTAPLRGMQGMRFTGLLRYFDTNVLYRQPVITGSVKLEKSVLADDYTYAADQTTHPIKAILTGPFTIAKSSRDEYYKSRKKLTLALAGALAEELQALERVGAKQIQINEPYLLSTPDEFELFKEAYEILMKGISAQITLYFSFGDFAKIFPRIMEIGGVRMGFDLTTTPKAKALLADSAFHGRKLLAGLVDARNTRLETADEVSELLSAATRRVAAEDVEVAPSANLEFLPLDRCRKKLKNMVDLVGQFKEEEK